MPLRADATILALGGASWPRLGSDGGWAAVLRAEGVAVEDFAASNCGVEVAWSDHLRARFAGTPLKRIALRAGDEVVEGGAADVGAAQGEAGELDHPGQQPEAPQALSRRRPGLGGPQGAGLHPQVRSSRPYLLSL